MQTKSLFPKCGLVVMSLVILSACAPVTPVTSPAPGSVEPLPATLEINGQTQTAGIGSYCWSGSQGKQTCTDVAGIPTAHDPLVTDTPFVGHFHLPLADPPESLYVSARYVTPYDDLTGGAGETRLWRSTSGWSSELPLKSEVDYEFLDGPGLYVVQLDARWKDRGDVAYGFLVQVGPANNFLPTTMPGTPFSTAVPLSLQILSPLARLGKGTVSSLSVSPDGRWLAIATPLGVYLYETATQKQVWYRQYTNKPISLAFSPDGSRLAIGLAGSILPVVDTRSGQTVMELTGEEGIHGVWSPDGKYLLTSGQCEQVLVWDAHSGQIAHELQPAKCNNATLGAVNAAWSWDGKRIYVNSGNGYVQAWDALTFQTLVGYQPHRPEDAWLFEVAPSPTQDLFALEDRQSMAILDGKTGELVKTLTAEGIANLLDNISWSPDGKRLLAGGYLWEVESDKLLKKFDDLSHLVWMPNGDTLVGTSMGNGSVEAVSISSGAALFSLAGFGYLSGEAPFWDGDTLLTFDGVNETRWDPRTGAMLGQHPASSPDPKNPGGLPRSPDGGRLARGGTVEDAKTGAQLVHLVDGNDRQGAVDAWSPDGTRIVSGDQLGLLPTIVWDAGTGKILLTLALDADGSPFLGALAWSPDGAWITAAGSLMNVGNGSDQGMIVLWNAPTGKQAHLLTAGMSSERIMSIAWSHDGHWLAAGIYSGRIVIWDMQKYLPIADLNGHADLVTGLSWSADDTRLASSSADGTVLIWELP